MWVGGDSDKARAGRSADLVAGLILTKSACAAITRLAQGRSLTLMARQPLRMMKPFALSLAWPEPVEAAKGWFDRLRANGISR